MTVTFCDPPWSITAKRFRPFVAITSCNPEMVSSTGEGCVLVFEERRFAIVRPSPAVDQDMRGHQRRVTCRASIGRCAQLLR